MTVTAPGLLVPGLLVLVVGPSGAGKDTLIALAREALEGDPCFIFPRRLVTRASGPWEDHDTLDEAGFVEGERRGAFALSWRAHGLGYALPGSVAEAARAGRVAVCNVSRRVIGEARERLPRVAVVEVTAPPEVLARRLAARGRGEDGDLRSRLARRVERDYEADLVILNDRTPAEGAGELVAFLKSRVAAPAEAAR